MNKHSFPHSLQAVRRDLVAHLYVLAYTLNASIRENSGNDMLGLPDDKFVGDWPAYDDFDLKPFAIDELLPALYRYAVDGMQDQTFDDDEEDGDLGRLLALTRLTSTGTVQRNFDDIREHHDADGQERGGLLALLDLVEVRAKFDGGREAMTLEEVARLVGTDRRTIANAMYAGGESRLEATKIAHGQYEVPPQELRRWLLRRGGFAWTVQTSRHPGVRQPDAVERHEVVGLLRERIDSRFRDHLDVQHMIATKAFRDVPESGRANAARRVGWTPEKLNSLLSGGAEQIGVDDVLGLAQLSDFSPVWLASQLGLRVTGGAATLGNSSEPTSGNNDMDINGTRSSPLSDDGKTLDVELTDAGIRNGYIDIETRFARRFFPEDAFGTRARGDAGQPIEFVVDGRNDATDIRQKSRAVTSPRMRFTAWFKGKQAQPGDVVRFERVGERRYTLTFVPAAVRG